MMKMDRTQSLLFVILASVFGTSLFIGFVGSSNAGGTSKSPGAGRLVRIPGGRFLEGMTSEQNLRLGPAFNIDPQYCPVKVRSFLVTI